MTAEPVTPGMFGWCMTGHHDACRVEIGTSKTIVRCGCACHGEAS